ncbi:bifunctional YncE family protein/alkaline phosphatase family protein [Dictyobacter aurantiacus]|nr:bifunctional YncE family protein/alkaline phosphatase family protein [Dictyobacter aurantiacus]
MRLMPQMRGKSRAGRSARRRLNLFMVTIPVLLIIAVSTSVAGACIVPSRESLFLVAHPGPQTGGTRLVDTWTITPAGSQLTLGDLPLNSVLSPDGRHLLISNGGAGIQSLQVVSTNDHKLIQTIPYTSPHSVFVGLAYSPDGRTAYAAGGGENIIHTYAVSADGLLHEGDAISLLADPSSHQNLFPTGLSLSPDGKRLYVANNLSDNMDVVDTGSKTVLASPQVGAFPYITLVSKDGKVVYVSNWGEATISVIDAATNTETGSIAVGQHPTAMTLSPDNRYLYVTDANSDAVSIVDTQARREVGRVSVAPRPHAQLSSSPQGLALSANGKTLYVVDAGNNEVVVINLQGNKGQVLGRIPTAWYPTSVNVDAANATLYVTNGKGMGAGPNDKRLYADPIRARPPIVDAVSGFNNQYCNCAFDGFTGSMIRGTLSTIEVPGAQRLKLYTDQVARNDGKSDAVLNERSPGNPIPRPGGTSPIKHVIYVVRENRTYDQVLGDERSANGDARLVLFPRRNTPNGHALAERFGLFDNFYADAEVSADGHNWINSANANDYIEKMWPQNYSAGPAGRRRPADFSGESEIGLSPGGYIWDAAAEAHITYRDYGEFYQLRSSEPPHLLPAAQEPSCPGPVAHTYISEQPIPRGQVLCFGPMQVTDHVRSRLANHYDPRYRSFDLDYMDADRVREWRREFMQFVAHNNLPQLEIVWLPNDHTQGTRTGKLTPQAMVADNDSALGQLVDTVSHSKYWASTAIFVTEDDSQNGPDHVDAHRTESLVISPYTSRQQVHVDHTLYDTAAMLRTIELILGLRALSQYDANAVPMWRAFTSYANLTPYTLRAENLSTSARNAHNAYGAATSAGMDFSAEDRISWDQLNRILWYAIKGTHVPYPGIKQSSTASHDDDDG